GAITLDGFLLCDLNTNSMRRFPGEIFSRQPLRAVTVSGSQVVVASDTNLFVSENGGEDFTVAFRAPAVDPINRPVNNRADRDKMLVFGNRFVWRRSPQLPSSEVDTQRLRRVNTRLLQDAYSGENQLLTNFRMVSLEDVIDAALERFELNPNQLATTRNVLRFRALFPSVIGTLVGSDAEERNTLEDLEAPTFAPADISRTGVEWGVFLTWDLRNLLQDAQQVNVNWRELERLRFRLVERVKDAYQNFERASRALDDTTLTPKQRMYLMLRQKEAAAYLHSITGERFEVLDPTRLQEKRKSVRRLRRNDRNRNIRKASGALRNTSHQ
ncbi:MAG: hypothetical protein AAF658_17580, partial [Myxococcota bacterium]